MTDGNSDLLYAGVREVVQNGDSITIALPKRAIRKDSDLDVDEVADGSATVKMWDNGEFEASLDVEASD